MSHTMMQPNLWTKPKKLVSSKLCKCGRPARYRQQCIACYDYRRRTGRPRPRRLWDRPSHCANPNCGRPLAANERIIKGRCNACYVYHLRAGIERPLELTGGNRWCDCGRPATQRIPIQVGAYGKREKMSLKREWLDLCDECAQFEMQEAA